MQPPASRTTNASVRARSVPAACTAHLVRIAAASAVALAVALATTPAATATALGTAPHAQETPDDDGGLW